jgi:hypothetical protein
MIRVLSLIKSVDLPPTVVKEMGCLMTGETPRVCGSLILGRYQDEKADTHMHVTMSGRLPSYPLSATLVEAPRSNERPSIELKISSRGAKILNAVVVDSAGRPLYTISGDESHTKLLSQRDNTKVATIDWDRSSPRMVFRGKKFKCKEWLPRAEPDTE